MKTTAALAGSWEAPDPFCLVGWWSHPLQVSSRETESAEPLGPGFSASRRKEGREEKPWGSRTPPVAWAVGFQGREPLHRPQLPIERGDLRPGEERTPALGPPGSQGLVRTPAQAPKARAEAAAAFPEQPGVPGRRLLGALRLPSGWTRGPAWAHHQARTVPGAPSMCPPYSVHPWPGRGALGGGGR